jgi:hypothetical protein
MKDEQEKERREKNCQSLLHTSTYKEAAKNNVLFKSMARIFSTSLGIVDK